MKPEELLDPRIKRTRRDIRKAAGTLLLEEGMNFVTHGNVARYSGYSRATIYAHWPEVIDLISEAFEHIGEFPHHTLTGDLRSDLIGELVAFRDALVTRRLGRVILALAERAAADPGIADLRDRYNEDCTCVMREILNAGLDPESAKISGVLLSGAVFLLTTMHDKPPSDEMIADIVDFIIKADA